MTFDSISIKIIIFWKNNLPNPLKYKAYSKFMPQINFHDKKDLL